MAEQALELDPACAAAYALLCVTYWNEWLAQWSPDPRQALTQALALAQKAVSLNESLPVAHGVLGLVYVWQKQHAWARAQTGQGIVSGHPWAALSYLNLRRILNFAGQPQEAIEKVEQALGFPSSMLSIDVYALTTLAQAYFLTGQHEEALEALEKALTTTGGDAFIVLRTHLYLAATYSELGPEAEAGAEIAEILKINPNFSLEVWQQRVPYQDQAVTEPIAAALRQAGLE